MTRIQKGGLVCCLMAGLGLAACSPEALARLLGGQYRGQTTTYHTCLYAAPDANQLVPNAACDLQNAGVARSYEILSGDNAGIDQAGEPCGFDFAYDQPVPLNGSSFEIDAQSPDGADQFAVSGTLEGDMAAGTSTKMNGVSRCTIDWRATHVNGGTGGAGGSGGSGGEGGKCTPSFDVGGDVANPEIWEEIYLCTDNDGNCFADVPEAVTLSLIQDGKDIDWEIIEGTGKGSKFAGELCDTSFKWTSQPPTPSEEGCWEFTADRFNKRSFGVDFKCVGTGRRGAGSTPAPLPSCKEIAEANVDYSQCPSAPPASPLDGGSAQ